MTPHRMDFTDSFILRTYLRYHRSTHSSQLHASKSIHRREGAFSPSASVSSESATPTETEVSPAPYHITPAIQEAPDVSIKEEVIDKSTSGDNDVPDVTVIAPPPRFDSLRAGLDMDRDESDTWVNISRDLTPSPEGRAASELTRSSGSRSRSPPYTADGAPSPPPKSHRNSLIASGLKRFSSLPRTPSSSTKSEKRQSMTSTQHSSRTPSPSPPMRRSRPRPKIKSRNPAAMYCSEVLSNRSARERCEAYAHKINELYMYDCGLGDWVVEARFRSMCMLISARHT